MDLNEFVQHVQPRKKLSRLISFKDPILTLKAQGYSDLQIRDWLAGNGIEVSRETVRKFIKNSAPAHPQQTTPATTGAESGQQDTQSGHRGAPVVGHSGLSQADKMRRKLDDQKRDADSNRFKHDKTGNT